MEKNQFFTAEITGCTSQGFGVARFEDRAVFIKGAIPGETCEIRLVKITKTAVYGRLEKVLQPSEHRMEPVCPHFGRCGGCDMMHMDYTLEAELKRQRVYDVLQRIGGVNPGELPMHAAPVTEGYRNKVQFPVGEKDGAAAAGFFRARTHEIIPIEHCYIQPEEAERIERAVLEWMQRYHILPYHEEKGTGYIRHIFVRKAVVTGQVMACLIVNAEKLPKTKQLTQVLLERVPELTTILYNVNTRPGNAILGETYHTVYGPGYIEDELCGLRFRLSPASFYQVNHDQAELLYSRAVALADLHGTETVLDLYCGTGTITLALSRHAGKVIGVEVIPQAIEDAKANAERNKIENAEFFCADAGEAAARLAADGIRPDVITVDPPRKGITQQVIDAMVTMAPERIVYVSCDPATLARDVKLLEESGYHYVRGETVDLFPRTKHVETVCLLSKLSNARNCIDVKLDMDELDVTSAETKATYEEIKAYVLEHSGMQVSSLYIAQVKREFGIIERENYNKAKLEESRQPQCPEEKKKAIREALIHFRMI